MKAVILCAGRGTRLRPLTHTNAKHMIPIGNKPILFLVIEKIIEAGIREIGIVVGETKDDIIEGVGDGLRWGIRVEYIEQKVPRGIADAVNLTRSFVQDDPFLVYLGDNLLKDPLTSFIAKFEEERPNCSLLLTRVDDPSRFGVALLDDSGQVQKVVEKPKEFISDLGIVGCYVFDRTVFDAIANIKPSWRNELEITDAIQYLITNDYVVKSEVIRNRWSDTGKPEDILEANRFVLENLQTQIHDACIEESDITGKVVIEEGAHICQSRIRGPVVIGKNVHIKNAFIGPFTSIGDDSEVCNAEIEHSVVMENCKISNIDTRLDECLLGKNVVVDRKASRPKAFRFILADNSHVEVIS